MAVKEAKVKHDEIPLKKIDANSGQTRGMGVMAQLLSLGYGVFEKISTDPEKFAIWPALVSDDPVERKKAAALIREHEPDIVNAAESQEQWDQLSPIRVVKTGNTYDVIFGMTRCLAIALNHAENPKAPDVVSAMVMDKVKDVDAKFMGYAENNDRRGESLIDKALFFQEAKKEFKLTPEEIGKRVGLTAQSIRDYFKLLHAKLADKRMDIHEGKLTMDAAKKLLAKRLAADGDGGDEDTGRNGTPSGDRARMPSIKKLESVYLAKQKPDWIEQKEWEMVIAEPVRKWLAFRLGKKYKPFTGEVLTKAEEPEKKEAAAPKSLKIAIPKKKAIRLLTALGKPESESWDEKQLAEKLENIVNIAEPGVTLDDESLQSLLEKLSKNYASGVTVTIK